MIWQPIETAPYAKPVLAWWRPINNNKHAEAYIIAERRIVETPHVDQGWGEYKEGCWWANGRYYDPFHIVAWMPLPAPPMSPEDEFKECIILKIASELAPKLT